MHHALPPFERCSLGIVRCQEAVDRFPDLMWRGKTRAAQSLARQDAKPDLDLIEPTGMGRCVVPVHIGVASPPAISLRLMTAQVVQHDVNLLLGVIGHHFVHEVQELPTPPTVVMTRLHLPGAHIQSGKEGGGAVALVFVVEPLQGLSVGKAQITLCALQGLNRGLLIHTQDHGMVGRRQVNPHQVGGFGGKLRVGRDTPTVPPLQADPVARQRSPDLARRHIAQGSGDQMAAPTGVTGGGRLIEQGQDTPFRLLAITPPPAGSWSILQAD